MQITKKVVFKAKPNCNEKMRELLQAMVVPSKAEQGCVLYEIYQSKEDESMFTAIETWVDDEALLGHQTSEHYKVYKSSYEPFCEEKYTEIIEIL